MQLSHDAGTLAGERYGPGAVDELIEHIDSECWSVSSLCAHAAQDLDARAAVPKIIHGKRHANYDVLAKMATPEAVDFLIECLGSDDERLRENTLGSLGSAGRWAMPILVELLDDSSLIVKGDGAFGQFGPPWPDHHRALNAMQGCLSQAGFLPKSINLAAGQQPDALDDQIRQAKAWWKKNGSDFLHRANVPNPNLQSVMWMR